MLFGAPLYIGSWLKEGRGFLERHRAELERKTVAVFTLGPTEDREKDWQEVRGQLKKQLEKYSWLEPVAVELFGGKFDPGALRFPDSLLRIMPASPLRNMPVSDIRDWEAIRAWARSVVELL